MVGRHQLSKLIRVSACSLSLWVATARAADKIPAQAAISPELSAKQQRKFAQTKIALDAELAKFKAAAAAFNGKDAEHQSDAEFNTVQAQRTRYIAAVKDFNEDMKAALEDAHLIKSLTGSAKRNGWSEEKVRHLEGALNSLEPDGDSSVTPEQIRATWETILSRDAGGELAREAAQGGGLGFPGAGTQTTNEDCAIYALANAAGLPYGVVGARATKLIQEGDWRPEGERTHPETAITRSGLSGGEVVMLAEAFGQAEVVPMTDFAKHLAQGRPVLVEVVPQNGNAQFGHEVVLTKTFKHQGETWFALMDSNQGPERRLFLREKELGALLMEKGVVYRPEANTTPSLLR